MWSGVRLSRLFHQSPGMRGAWAWLPQPAESPRSPRAAFPLLRCLDLPVWGRMSQSRRESDLGVGRPAASALSSPGSTPTGTDGAPYPLLNESDFTRDCTHCDPSSPDIIFAASWDRAVCERRGRSGFRQGRVPAPNGLNTDELVFAQTGTRAVFILLRASLLVFQ